MAPQTLTQRSKGPPTTAATIDGDGRRTKKAVMAKKGLRSLAFAVGVPLILTTCTAYLTGCSPAVTVTTKSSWRHTPVWAFHLASVSTSCLMGLAAWLFWAEGGFHRLPTMVPLFTAQFLLGIFWGPLVFGLGATRTGLVVCVLLLGALFGCAQCFRKVNPISGDLVKPCLAWVCFLAVFNYKIM